MSIVKVEYEKNGEKVSNEVNSNELKKLLKEVVKIQVSTRYESFETKDSISEFLKKYKKYGVKNLSEKYKTSKDNIKNKLISLGVAVN